MNTRVSRMVVIAIAAAGIVEKERKSKKRKRATWVKPWLLKRKFGVFHTLLHEFRVEESLNTSSFCVWTVKHLMSFLGL